MISHSEIIVRSYPHLGNSLNQISPTVTDYIQEPLTLLLFFQKPGSYTFNWLRELLSQTVTENMGNPLILTCLSL